MLSLLYLGTTEAMAITQAESLLLSSELIKARCLDCFGAQPTQIYLTSEYRKEIVLKHVKNDKKNVVYFLLTSKYDKKILVELLT